MMHAVVIQSSEALMAMENALRKSPRRKTVNQMSGMGFPSGLRHWEKKNKVIKRYLSEGTLSQGWAKCP